MGWALGGLVLSLVCVLGVLGLHAVFVMTTTGQLVDDATLVGGSIGQRFTEDFKDYFQRNTSIKQVARDGDLQFEGQIIAFDYAPAAIQQQNGQDQAGVNRLTIQVRIKFTNTKDPKQDFEQTFQSNGDFPATQDIARINNDPTAVRRITQNIITDAFNKSVANW